MSSERDVRHWASDPYWAEALETYDRLRKHRRRLVLDLERIERELFAGNSPAYRLLDAMRSVHVHEEPDGYRGAPRVVLALLARLAELSTTSRQVDGGSSDGTGTQGQRR